MARRRLLHWFLALTIISALPALSFGQNAGADRKARVLALSRKIDEFIESKWKEAKVTGAAPAEPGTFFRRLSLDLTGKIPDFVDVQDYIDFCNEDKSQDRNWQWVERLINDASEDNQKENYFSRHFAAIYRSLMLGDNVQQQFQFFTPQFETWLKSRLSKNVGYDKIVREVITSGNDPNQMYQQVNGGSPGAFYFVNENKPENMAAAVTRTFLGVKLECAQCHKHPFAEWTRDQFWEFAAFFAGLNQQNFRPDGGGRPVNPNSREIKIPNTNKTVKAKYINGKEPEWKDNDNPRNVLANWIVSPKNPYFAKAAVDQLWSNFFGVSLLEPIMEASDDSPITHPELLDELARQFVEEKYDIKFIVQAITMTNAYARASTGKDKASKDDYNLFIRMPVRGLTPEQLFDSLSFATFYTGGSNQNMGFNQFGQPNTPRSEFLQRFTSQDRRHESQTSILQALFLMNGGFMAERVDPEKNLKLKHLVVDQKRTPAQKVLTMYSIVVSRLPTQAETDRLVRYIENSEDRARAYSDIYWALLNSGEFMLNH